MAGNGKMKMEKGKARAGLRLGGSKLGKEGGSSGGAVRKEGLFHLSKEYVLGNT